MSEKKGSDVYLSQQSPILIKIHGALMQMSEQLLSPAQIRQLIGEVVTPEQLQELDDEGELNASVTLAGGGLFRLSAFRQRGSLAAVFRCIPTEIPPLNMLGVPPTLAELIMEKRGLILMVGAAGTGKSTTLAAMLEYRNTHMAGHILTIEDPVEFLFSHKKSVVNQREVGRDTKSLHVALRNALRQAPDVILIGEIRDAETMSAAISYALSGHLVVATLHGNNSYHALGRILSLYPLESRDMLLADLAAALKAIISQRLLRATTGGRVAAVEVMVNTKLTAELIERGDFNGVRDAMEKSMTPGSQTFEQDLARLIRADIVTREEALLHADSPSNLMWRMQNDDPPSGKNAASAPPAEEDDQTVFTEVTLDVIIEKPKKNLLFPTLNA
jgi:twitching motility protein PilU